MTQQVKAAVFPVAGRGTRFLPVTKASPKEMLPIVDKPLIQYAVDEALSAGADTLIFITGSSKRAIEDHFDSNPELEAVLQAQGKQDLLDTLRGILPSWASCVYIRQSAPLGLGHAVLCARPVVGDAPFMVHLADDYGVKVGRYCTIGHSAIIHACDIGDECLIGMGATILDGAQIGDHCIVGANSLVTQRFVAPPGSMILGSPAKVVRQLTETELLGLRAWAEGIAAAVNVPRNWRTATALYAACVLILVGAAGFMLSASHTRHPPPLIPSTHSQTCNALGRVVAGNPKSLPSNITTYS